MKEDKKPMLSICIPTWNRWYALQHTLKSIIDQDEFKSWNVEIIISDNASTDETEIEVWKLCKKYKNIRYFRNKKNIWGNPNINKALSLWEWEYLWLLWSDDLILDRWLKRTLDIIKNTKPDLILHKNSQCPNCKQLDYTIKGWDLVFMSQKDYFNYLWDWYCFDKRSFMHIENLQTFMSLICMKKSYYKKCLDSILDDKIWGKKFNTFYFSQNLISHFCEINSMVLFRDCYISELPKTNDDKTINSWYNFTKDMVNDIKLLYHFYDNKYDLNDNFRKLAKKSSQYRNLCIIYSFLWNIFWKGFVKFLSNVYHYILW